MTSTVPPRRVIVDDGDPQIQYSSTGQWTLIIGGTVPDATPNGPPFQNTTHLSTTTSSLSFQFQGSSPQVFGTSVVAPYECFIDGTSIGSIPALFGTGNNNLLCDGTPFVEGKEYTLTLNVTHRDGMLFWFDYATYIPTTPTPPGPATVLVDRLDPAIAYSTGGWVIGTLGSQAGSSTFTPANLGSFTQTNGSSLAFNFTGTSVSWVGFTPQMTSGSRSTSNAIYSVDNAKPVVFKLPSGSSSENRTYQVFFTSPTLSPGPHSLEVTYQGNSTTPPLALNHFVVTNNAPTPSPAPSASSQPPAVSSTAATRANKPSAPAPIGAIIGGVVGGITVLCLAAFLLRRRSRQWSISHKSNGGDTSTPSHLMPFDAMPSEPTMAEASNRTLKGHHSLMVDPPEFDPYILLDRPSGIDDVDATPRAQILNERKLSLRASPVETVHENRGARSATDGVADPPPSYAS